VDFDATGQFLIMYFVFDKYLRKKWEYDEAVHQLFMEFKTAYNSIRIGVFITFAMSLVSP
jgi:hypothetical protein